MDSRTRITIMALVVVLFLASPILKMTNPCLHSEISHVIGYHLGNGESTRTLALMNLNGSCIDQNVVEGKTLLMEAAESDDAESQALIGAMKLAGKTFDKDPDNGLYWLRRAKENGSLNAAEALKAFDVKK